MLGRYAFGAQTPSLLFGVCQDLQRAGSHRDARRLSDRLRARSNPLGDSGADTLQADSPRVLLVNLALLCLA